MAESLNEPLVVFAYNFPHKKTQDVLLHLFALGYRIGWVLAADPVKLKIPPPSVRTKIRHQALLPPSLIAERIGAEYIVAPHNSEEVRAFLERIKPALGIIGGARILKGYIIGAFRIGIINLHPGLLPEMRGLDAMLWAIHEEVPQGVTAHLIDEKVDAGRILVRREIPLYADDTLLDVSERLYDTQLELLDEAIQRAIKGEVIPFVGNIPHGHRKMPTELEQATAKKFESYKTRLLAMGERS